MVSQSLLEELRKCLIASGNKIQANFLLFMERSHIQEMLDCIVYSSLDVCVIR